jgi:carboxypeptidase PM20D1
MKRIGKILLIGVLVIVVALVLLVSVLAINTTRLTSKQMEVEPASAVALNSQEIAEHLAGAIQFPTISYRDAAQIEGEEFIGLHEYLEQTFPQVHATLAKEVVGDYSLLYTWQGLDEGLKPILLMAHMDVVPIEPGTEGDWTYSPFEGRIAEGYIWGRGALDDKGSLVGILEAVETLLEEGFQPQRTIYLAFGEDEEIGGQGGAAQIADLLQSRGVELEYVLDEGMPIIVDAFPGLPRIAMLGIAEKGYLSLELIAEGKGGHSSTPPPHTAVGVLSAAITKLEENPFPAKLEGLTRQMFTEYLAPEMDFGMRMVMGNPWFFGGVIKSIMTAQPEPNAWLRTTTAATMFEGSIQDNVVPARARAVVNFRILPGESVASVTEHVRQTIDDPQVQIKPLLGPEFTEPSFVSDTSSPNFETLQRTIHQVFPEAVVTPGLLFASTDTRHYLELSDNIYRFGPILAQLEDTSGIHGTNERIPIESYEQTVRFYIQLIRNSAQ